jgi:hypothetical protein
VTEVFWLQQRENRSIVSKMLQPETASASHKTVKSSAKKTKFQANGDFCVAAFSLLLFTETSHSSQLPCPHSVNMRSENAPNVVVCDANPRFVEHGEKPVLLELSFLNKFSACSHSPGAP